MAEVSKDLGVLAVLATRMTEERLPKALAIKERIDKGGVLNDMDLNFLEQIIKEAGELKPIMDRNPAARDIGAQMLHLYREITEKALANEKAKQK
jgi:hypothetical protein